MKIGGGNHGIGIHGTHLGRSKGEVVIRYGHSDEGRQEIPWVESIVNGKRTVYKTPEAKDEGAGLHMREMDCMDCHNRPSHTFDLPERALDRAMANGAISPALPWVKKQALELLKAEYTSREEAARRIPAAFVAFYERSHPEVWTQHTAEVKEAANEVLAIWSRNIFPAMKVTWGKYPINIGHNDFPGCFRCHDGNHGASDGRTISQDCNACHNTLAMEEENPKVLTDLGITEAKK